TTTSRPNEASVAKTAIVEHAPVASTVAAAPKGLLVLNVRKDSWVEVKVGKNPLISRLMRAGSTEQVEITESASLTLGNAAGVDATFRGNPLDIKAEAKNNVVHLSLQ
ncbi:MAG TPA: DUF4115 domain-containing protein, partial [Burkholderiaceae bacterium]|nr:DUF4115 domain-containing protein [Burkholderiaceae bacterium]